MNAEMALKIVIDAAERRLVDMEAAYDNPESESYDSGAVYWDMEALREALKMLRGGEAA